MMFENFKLNYKIDNNEKDSFSESDLAGVPSQLRALLQEFSGASFNKGIYRIHEINKIRHWTEIATKAFPQFKGVICSFASDWMGRQFALDLRSLKGGSPEILLIEPGSGKAYVIPLGIEEFHNQELVNEHEPALGSDLYEDWVSSGEKPPKKNQCIGFKVPLNLGGDEEIENMEEVDLEVYWDISTQVLNKVRGLPNGTPVNIS